MKIFRTLALIGAGLLVRKWAARRSSGSRAQASKAGSGFDVDTRPMAYPLEQDSAPDASALGPQPTVRPALP